MIKKIKQFFCRHKHKTWYTEMPKGFKGFMAISGERRFLICDKCEKVTHSYFAEYEGNGFK